MAKINRNQAPYYDDYDSSNQYTHLLAVPGRVAQARELTQVQSTVKDIIKSIGDSILKDGNIIEGCQVSVDKVNRVVKVSPGKVYLNGMVLPVRGSRNATTGEYEPVLLDITAEGTEIIGFRLMEYIITEREDDHLRDPAQGYDNYNQPGCHRIKSEVAIVKNDPDAATLVTLIDGDISVERYAPEYDTLTQTLARRTYDESGSYIVEGLNVRVENHLTDSTKINVVIEPGKTYVLGYELKIPSPRRIAIPRSTETRSYSADHFIYSNSSDYTEISDTPYIESLTSVIGRVNYTKTNITYREGEDVLLDHTGVTAIVSIKQGSTTLTSSDYSLVIRNDQTCYIHWNASASSKLGSGSITVVYTYKHLFTKGTDYELYHDLTTDTQSIHWISTSKPLNNSPLDIIYNLYLARKDTVYIDQNGEIGVSLGAPTNYGFEQLPEAPVNTLALAYIMSPPAGSVSTNPNTRIVVSNVGLTRFTMNDIQRLLNRIRTLEYDQTILSLNDEAKQYDTAGDKKGIFTDPLIDISKIDLYYNLSNGVAVSNSDPTFTSAIDIDSNICHLSTKKETLDAVYDSVNSDLTEFDRTVTLKKTGERVVIAQSNATRSFLVNPYSMFPQMPEISIDPAVDVWIDDTIITIPVSQQTSEIASVSTNRIESTNTRGAKRADTVSTTYTDTSIGTKVSVITNESVISEEAITYIRPRTINVEGSHYPASLDNIKCYFDGAAVSLTPTGTTMAGTAVGSIKSNDAGTFTATFTIPENVLTGIREVRVESDTIVDGYETSAFALYQASGTSRTIQKTVTTLTTILLNRVTTVRVTHNVDPVGQTFVVDRMTMISGIDLYFEAKPSGTTPVTCEIREVSNGSITSTYYGHRTLPATSVNVSSDSKVATRFTFDSPVLLEANKEYAFVVKSTSPSYRLWIADLGENDIITSNPVLTNPYLIGVMMSSSNNSSWTTHQTSDVKFRLIADEYAMSSEVLFNTITPDEEFSRIYLLADALIPDNTSVSWYYSVDNGGSYTEITPYNMTLLSQLKQTIKIKAIMTRESNTSLSPVIATDSIGAVVSKYDNENDGWYISKEISGLSNYTDVDVIIDAYYPNSNTGINVYVSNGTTRTEATLQPEASGDRLAYSWKRQTYRATVSQSTTCRIFIKLSSNSSVYTPAFRRLRVIMS